MTDGPNKPGNASQGAHDRRDVHLTRVAASVLLLMLAGIALSACASTTSPAAQAAAREARIAHQEHAELTELVNCAHQHGIDLPPPTSGYKISTRGLNLKSPARKAALSNCYHEVVDKATKRQEAERVREGKSAKPSEEQTTNPAEAQAAFAQEHERLVAVVACARRHGIPLPEPDSHNRVNTKGIDLKGRRREVAMSNCFHEVVARATREQEEQAGAQEQGAQRLGSGSSGP